MALQLILMENRRALRRERVFRDRKNPLDEYDDVEMYKKYRFTRFGSLHIIDRVEAHLHHPTQRNHALPQVFKYSCITVLCYRVFVGLCWGDAWM